MLMRAPLIRLVIALGLVALLLPAAGAQQPQQPPPQQPPPATTPPATQDPQRPIFKTGINFISVDVIVSDKNGNPVLDLKPEEFSVSEDGKAQKIEQFSIVKIDPLDQIEGPTNGPIRTQQDEQREAARPEVR